MKKILIIIGAVIILGAIGFGIWYYFTGKTPDQAIEKIGGLFPIGGGSNIGTGITEEGGGTESSQITEHKILTQLTQNAISGAVFYKTPSIATKTPSVNKETLGVEESIGMVRYVEKQTGHIFEVEPQGGQNNRLSNITILKTFDTIWSSTANNVILRYAEESSLSPVIQNYSINLNPQVSGKGTTTPTSIEGVFIPKSIETIVSAPDRDRIFYLSEFEGNTIGIISTFENEKREQILSTPFSEFNISWPNKNIISLLTKPSASQNGFLYALNPTTKSFKKVVGNIKGLTVGFSPNGEKIIFTESKKNSFSTLIYDSKTNGTSSFGVTTFPEKCIWGNSSNNVVYCAVPKDIPNGEYPDEWYQGLVSFTDSIWRIDLINGATEEIYATDFDIINPFLSTNEDFIFFTNKNDETLWSLKIKD